MTCTVPPGAPPTPPASMVRVIRAADSAKAASSLALSVALALALVTSPSKPSSLPPQAASAAAQQSSATRPMRGAAALAGRRPGHDAKAAAAAGSAWRRPRCCPGMRGACLCGFMEVSVAGDGFGFGGRGQKNLRHCHDLTRFIAYLRIAALCRAAHSARRFRKPRPEGRSPSRPRRRERALSAAASCVITALARSAGFEWPQQGRAACVGEAGRGTATGPERRELEWRRRRPGLAWRVVPTRNSRGRGRGRARAFLHGGQPHWAAEGRAGIALAAVARGWPAWRPAPRRARATGRAATRAMRPGRLPLRARSPGPSTWAKPRAPTGAAEVHPDGLGGGGPERLAGRLRAAPDGWAAGRAAPGDRGSRAAQYR